MGLSNDRFGMNGYMVKMNRSASYEDVSLVVSNRKRIWLQVMFMKGCIFCGTTEICRMLERYAAVCLAAYGGDELRRGNWGINGAGLLRMRRGW